MVDNSLDKSLLKTLNNATKGAMQFFDRGDYYVVYNEDAKRVARSVLLSETGLKKFKLGDCEITYHNLNRAQFARVVREALTIFRYRVELYEADDGEWVLRSKGTPSNFADFEELIGSTMSQVVMAMQIVNSIDESENRVALVFCDSLDGRIIVADFNDTALFSTFEQCIIGMMPKECLFVETGYTCKDKKKKIDQILKRTNVAHAEIVEKRVLDISHLFKDQLAFENLSQHLKECVSAVLSFLKLDNQETLIGSIELCNYKTTGYMQLNAAAVEALDIFERSTSYRFAAPAATLFSTINKCETLPGRRLLREWLARPLSELRQIEERQDVVAALIACSEERLIFKKVLKRLPDISQLARKLCQKKAKLQDCYKIYQVVRSLANVKDTLRSVVQIQEYAQAVNELILEPISVCCLELERFLDLIVNTVDFQYADKTGAYRIKPEIDPDLLNVAEKMAELESTSTSLLKKASKKFNADLKLEQNSTYGFFYRVTLKEEKAIRNHGKSIIILGTSKGAGVRFRDDALDDLNSEYIELEKMYSVAQDTLEKEVVSTAYGYAPVLNQLTTIIANLDVFVGLATHSVESVHPYTRPKLYPMGSGILEIKQARHPVVEAVSHSSFIPNDISLDPEHRLIVLTGANMGGKSTYLRSAALCILLAQIGAPVPADDARISIVDAIFTRVGASDHQCQGISTFMAEMIESATILETATTNSFVIVDELGRGTSTFDGFGLAWAIACDLLQRVRCFCMFATHFHEMAQLQEFGGVRTLQMAVHVEDDKIVLLYKVQDGVASRSFGINVAKMVGLPESIVSRAEKALAELEGTAQV